MNCMNCGSTNDVTPVITHEGFYCPRCLDPRGKDKTAMQVAVVSAISILALIIFRP